MSSTVWFGGWFQHVSQAPSRAHVVGQAGAAQRYGIAGRNPQLIGRYGIGYGKEIAKIWLFSQLGVSSAGRWVEIILEKKKLNYNWGCLQDDRRRPNLVGSDVFSKFLSQILGYRVCLNRSLFKISSQLKLTLLMGFAWICVFTVERQANYLEYCGDPSAISLGNGFYAHVLII